MNRKDTVLAFAAAVLVLAMLAPTWFDARLLPANFGDLYAYHYPMRHAAAGALQAGRLPFWNPYIFSGLPLFANPQSALFYPVSSLWALFPLSLSLSWDFAFHLFWAMLGMALLARRAKLSAASAWTLALVYGLGPFLIYRMVAGIPTLLASLAWAPWCWLAWSARRPGWLGVVWSLQLLSGHPQFLIINACGMGLWALFGRGARARLVQLGRAAAWACALTAAQWLPTWEFLRHSVRRSWPREFSLGYSLEWPSLLTWLRPDALGDPVAGTFAGPPSVFFETSALYIGVLASGLAAYGFFCGKRRWATSALGAAGLALALGKNSPLYSTPLAALFSDLRIPSRWLLLCLWSLLLHAGAALRRLDKHVGRPALALLIAGVAAELLWWDARFLAGSRVDDYLAPNASLVQNIAEAPHRLITDPDLANPNKTILYRARNANGYEAFYLDGYPQYAARSEGAAAADASRTYLRRLGTAEMDRLGVLWRITPQGRLETSRTALPLAYFAGEDSQPRRAPLSLAFDRPERWRVAGAWPAGARALVLAQPLYPGWTAYVDGKPAALELWDGLLQAVPRPREARDGEAFVVDAAFSPTAWPLCAAVSLAAWVAWAARRRAELA